MCSVIFSIFIIFFHLSIALVEPVKTSPWSSWPMYPRINIWMNSSDCLHQLCWRKSLSWKLEVFDWRSLVSFFSSFFLFLSAAVTALHLTNTVWQTMKALQGSHQTTWLLYLLLLISSSVVSHPLSTSMNPFFWFVFFSFFVFLAQKK